MALRFGRLSGVLTRAGRRPPAIEHGMVLVVRDVAATGAQLFDPWWEGAAP